jgi:hypothetical protein
VICPCSKEDAIWNSIESSKDAASRPPELMDQDDSAEGALQCS